MAIARMAQGAGAAGLARLRGARRRASAARSLLLLVLPLLTGGPVAAQVPESESPPLAIPGLPTPATDAPGEGDGIDSLLKLPSGFLAPNATSVAGAGEAEWRRRFERALSGLEQAQQALERTRRSLDEAAESGGSSQWSVAPPGASNSGGPTNSPLSFKLRQEMARNREALEEAEKALRELRIEADLAGVPAAWRGDENRPIPRRIPDSSR